MPAELTDLLILLAGAKYEFDSVGDAIEQVEV